MYVYIYVYIYNIYKTESLGAMPTIVKKIYTYIF